MKLSVTLALTATCLQVLGADLVLKVQPPRAPIRVGDDTRFTVFIRNRGPEPVTLVEPGDGSECGWRTPIVGWSVLPVEARQQRHPTEPPRFKGTRCGNINPLRLSEVFSLAVGEGRRLGGWIAFPMPEQAGRYRVVLYYQNIPDLKISGLALGQHEQGVMDRVRRSTPCRVISSEIEIEVLPRASGATPAACGDTDAEPVVVPSVR